MIGAVLWCGVVWHYCSTYSLHPYRGMNGHRSCTDRSTVARWRRSLQRAIAPTIICSLVIMTVIVVTRVIRHHWQLSPWQHQAMATTLWTDHHVTLSARLRTTMGAIMYEQILALWINSPGLPMIRRVTTSSLLYCCRKNRAKTVTYASCPRCCRWSRWPRAWWRHPVACYRTCASKLTTGIRSVRRRTAHWERSIYFSSVNQVMLTCVP